jgi:hypothetical protein
MPFHAITFKTEDQTDDQRTAYRDRRRQLLYGTFFVLAVMLLMIEKALCLQVVSVPEQFWRALQLRPS